LVSIDGVKGATGSVSSCPDTGKFSLTVKRAFKDDP